MVSRAAQILTDSRAVTSRNPIVRGSRADRIPMALRVVISRDLIDRGNRADRIRMDNRAVISRGPTVRAGRDLTTARTRTAKILMALRAATMLREDRIRTASPARISSLPTRIRE